ncbi:hypothetical protein [Flavobacterium degerlachei]|jgi:hypothetical protein|uniref:YXWGXW repeat-containing protein n=1 Tax=Flavobacterium degerlachei TaxID=229203 RepID=A0A1H2ZZ62_9FLAO|nr:hypothetical protein [Flavobacterium degerlachei]SDX22812.1 hypothetical protein SAMN05444338_10873 [Flavobacterium degerlachei]
MKTLKLIAAGIILLVSSTSNAQLSINLNIGTAPVYHNSRNVAVGYYYMPDIQSYYDVRANQYIYLERGNWKRSRNLPNQYRRYDVNNGYKVALNDYHGNRPYTNYNNDKTRYYVGYRGENQRTVQYRNDNRIDYNKKESKYHKNNRYASNSNQKGHDKNDHKRYDRR